MPTKKKTGNSGSKKKLIIVGEMDALKIAAQTYSYVGRRTTLKELLIEK